MDFKIIPTINVTDATNILRGMGMRISPDTLRDGIEQGQFPFGHCIRSRTGNPVYFVYKRLFDQWVAERALEGGAAT